MKRNIIAQYPGGASIALDDETQTLFVVCSRDGTQVLWNWDATEWRCSLCSVEYPNDRAKDTAAFYPLRHGDVRYSAAEWVASWWGIDNADEVEVSWPWR